MISQSYVGPAGVLSSCEKRFFLKGWVTWPSNKKEDSSGTQRPTEKADGPKGEALV